MRGIVGDGNGRAASPTSWNASPLRPIRLRSGHPRHPPARPREHLPHALPPTRRRRKAPPWSPLRQRRLAKPRLPTVPATLRPIRLSSGYPLRSGHRTYRVEYSEDLTKNQWSILLDRISWHRHDPYRHHRAVRDGATFGCDIAGWPADSRVGMNGEGIAGIGMGSVVCGRPAG